MKKQIFKFLILTVMMMVIFTACGTDNSASSSNPNATKTEESVVDKIKASGKLVMGTNAAFPPFEYVEVVDSKNQIVGFDIDIATEIAKELGVELEIKDINFQSLLIELEAGTIDMVAAGMTIKPDRLEQADFSDTYFNAKQAVIVLEDDDKINSAADLEGLKIGCQVSTTGQGVTEEITDKVSAYNAITQGVMDLQQGKLDAVIIDLEPAKAITAANKDSDKPVKYLEFDDFEAEDYAIALKKVSSGDNELRDVVNTVLARIKSDGTYEELVNKYFSADAE